MEQYYQILNNEKSVCDNIYLSKNGITIADPKQVANPFNNYFVTVPEKLTKEIGEANKKYQDLKIQNIKS